MMTTRELINALRGLYVTVDFAKYIEPGLNFESLSKAADRLEELESKQENLIDYNADLNNRLDKAECHIEKLEKQLSENQPEWISVEDRLPGAYGRYISYNREDIKIRSFDPVRQGSWILGEVTHWMPLPEPPNPKAQKFRKKPIVVEAYQTDRKIVIPTLEGDMIARRGDYIITGVNGEQYPCKQDIFEKTYEPYFEEEGEE